MVVKPLFKPSQLDPFARSYLPFVDTFKKSEVEVAAAMAVAALVHHGDEWTPLAPRQIGEWMHHIVGQKTDPWFSLLNNPFARPDFPTLVEHGWARWVEDGSAALSRPIELTQAFFDRVVEKRWA